MAPRVTVCIPALNEGETIGSIVSSLVAGKTSAADEVIVVDDASTDATAREASSAGALVVRGPGKGKGLAMATGLAQATGDIVAFLDGDVTNFKADFVTKLVAPLLAPETASDTHLTKAYYDRPLNGIAGEGGRVTELLAKPLIRRLFPELSGIHQPLAGEWCGWKKDLLALGLEDGYGVEIGVLIDIANKFGADSIVQVDLGTRSHRNRPLSELAGIADDVAAALLARTTNGSARDRFT